MPFVTVGPPSSANAYRSRRPAPRASDLPSSRAETVGRPWPSILRTARSAASSPRSPSPRTSRHRARGDDGDPLSALHDVVVRDDDPVGANDEAGARPWPSPPNDPCSTMSVVTFTTAGRTRSTSSTIGSTSALAGEPRAAGEATGTSSTTVRVQAGRAAMTSTAATAATGVQRFMRASSRPGCGLGVGPPTVRRRDREVSGVLPRLADRDAAHRARPRQEPRPLDDAHDRALVADRHEVDPRIPGSSRSCSTISVAMAMPSSEHAREGRTPCER